MRSQERLFVDYAGDGVPVVVDRLTGEIHEGQIFVAVLGAHVQAFGAIGGAPHLLVPDNTKAGVIREKARNKPHTASSKFHR
jgi:transposase